MIPSGMFTEQVKVLRFDNSGKYVNGYFVPNSQDPEEIVINASIQPLTGRELLLLPEGERTTTQLKLYTDTELRTATVQSQSIPRTGETNADVVLYNGNKYEVQKVERYSLIRPHYKCMLRSVFQKETPC